MLVRDLMSRDIHGVSPDTSLQEAAMLMRSYDVGALPVCERERLIGIITDRDIAVRATAEGRNPQEACVCDAMSDSPTYCFEDEDIEKAARAMEQRQIRRLPVLARDMRLIGMLALSDLVTRQRDDGLSNEVLEHVSQPIQQHRWSSTM